MESERIENSYVNILRRLSAFGGVQVFNVLVSLLRGKLVSIFLGPFGMGMSSLYNNAILTLQQFAGLGLNLVFVKEVASAKKEGSGLEDVVSIATRMIVLTSLLGGLLCVLLSPLLSLWTFGTCDYTIGFMFLALSVACSIASCGYLSLLQGVGAVKRLAMASMVGGLAGLVVGVPLYYFMGTGGIVPALVALYSATFIFYYVSFRNSGYASKTRFQWHKFKPTIIRYVRLGLVLVLGSLAGTVSTYLLNLFIREFGSMEDVGLYQAAMSLTNQYMGILMSALTLDYFPRLAASSSDDDSFSFVVNRQLEVVNLISAPIIIALIYTAPLVIRILLSEEFLPITQLMRWMGLAMLLRCFNNTLGYTYLAKEDTRLFFVYEVVFGNLFTLICGSAFYYSMGLVGLGISMTAMMIVDNIVYYIMVRYRYGIKLSIRSVKVSLLAYGLGITAFVVSFSDEFSMYVLPCLLLVSIVTSLYLFRKWIKK